MTDASTNLGMNLRRLRADRGLSQQKLADLSGIPRPTWASLETGSANPTLAVLSKVASALNVSIEELLSPPRNEFELIRAGELPARKKQGATVRALVPEVIPGMEITRTELTPGGRMVGTPHKAGTREYLTCESGRVELVAAGQSHVLRPGDMLVFRGDQRHSYVNPDPRKKSVSFSVVLFAR